MMNKKIVWAALLMCLLLTFAGCKAKKDKNDPEKPTGEAQSTETREIGFYTTDEDCFSIETEYGTLEYPEKWKDMIKTEITDEDVYTVRFFCLTSAGDIPLFDISFDGGEGFWLGTLPVGEQYIPVYLDSFEIDQSGLTKEEYDHCCAMEEDINVLISRLIEKNGFIVSDGGTPYEPSEEEPSVYSVETKYGSLFYPEKWKELAETEITEEPVYTVRFSAGTANGVIPLFDLAFNGSDGYCLGQMSVDGQTVTLCINEHPIDKESMSEEDYFNCCAMCEDINVILGYLVEDHGFTYGSTSP